jgi:hypothetical protein
MAKTYGAEPPYENVPMLDQYRDLPYDELPAPMQRRVYWLAKAGA